MKNIKHFGCLFLGFFVFQCGFAQNGILKGKTFDAKNNQPLPFVTVYINGTDKGNTSDINGDFTIEGITPGFVQVVASSVGFEKSLSGEVMISYSNTSFVEIYLQPTNINLNEVIVTGAQFVRKDESPLSMRTIGLSEIENNPGSNRDVSKVIQSLPGVGITPVFRNDLVIRGGGPNECRFYLDDIEIPNLNHFATQGASGGAVGIINADFIQSVNFYSGAFPSNRGNALSGVFEFTQVEGNEEKWKARMVMGASELSGTVDGPTGKSASLIFSVRRSYLQFLFSALGLPFLPTFTDYQFKERIHINKNNELCFVGIGALDQFRLNTGLKNPTEQQRYILGYLPVNEQWNYAIGGVYKHFGKRSLQTLVLSRNMLNNTSYKYPNNNENLEKSLDYKSQEIENKIRFENTAYLDNIKINFGFSGEYAKYNNSTRQKIFFKDTLLIINYNSKIDLFKGAVFGQINRTSPNNRFVVSVGFRMDANNYSSSMANPFRSLSPRASLSYKLNQKFSVNASLGKYFLLPAYTTLGYRDSAGVLVNKNNDLTFIQAHHLNMGIEFKPDDNSLMTLEGFYKKYKNYPFSKRDSICLVNKGADFGTIGDEEVLSTGTGRAFGFEFLTRRKLIKGFTLIFSYTFVRSEFQDKKDQWIPSSWDSRHIISLASTRAFNRNWNVGLKWRFSGGLPYTPYDMEASSYVQAWDSQGRAFPDYNQLNSKRLKTFHQLDLRIDKKYFFKKWTLGLYIDIQNLYNFQAQQPDIVLQQLDSNGNPEYQDPLQTKYLLKSISNPTGTILPTIGLLVQF